MTTQQNVTQLAPANIAPWARLVSIHGVVEIKTSRQLDKVLRSRRRRRAAIACLRESVWLICGVLLIAGVFYLGDRFIIPFVLSPPAPMVVPREPQAKTAPAPMVVPGEPQAKTAPPEETFGGTGTFGTSFAPQQAAPAVAHHGTLKEVRRVTKTIKPPVVSPVKNTKSGTEPVFQQQNMPVISIRPVGQ